MQDHAVLLMRAAKQQVPQPPLRHLAGLPAGSFRHSFFRSMPSATTTWGPKDSVAGQGQTDCRLGMDDWSQSD